MIGKLEEMTLMALLRCGPKALPSAVYERLRLGQKSAAFGAVYTTLNRLAKKGLIDEVDATDATGRSRRGFSITGNGRVALQDSISATANIGGFTHGGADAFA